ncbi:TonB-dependent receptor [Prevotella sp. PJ1A]|uniref:TonB-dependent receptor n=2 Tax=Xylanibacter rodentium TaxID=2736289 RepID=A0ABX2AU05_9BACT|nr:TonB-dependent receptor [Prevotella sp. PJ1A]NPE13969.1 TonB-dependent receptor [Xylanibacter rodentium]NPE38191.1 TonB-dependent receptor [Prevotella sp. PCJ2]
MMNFRKLFKRTERAGSLFITLMLIMFSASAAAQDGKLKGNVTGASDGEPLIGVSVVVKGTSKGSVTDYDGNYALNGLKRGDIVVFSYIGYTAAEQTYNGQQTMDIKLKEDSRTLDDVVVIGYGTMKKKLVTGATMQLKGDDIQKLNTVNPLSAMQGQTPGVNIVSTSGQPGASMSVTIRGLGTVGNSQPLYLIDGIAGDITNLNPADIERIDVLKDAASAAIYGAQAANGVILVTTKSGKEGTSKISYDGYVGWQTVGRKFDMLNSREYMSIMDEARLNSGMSPVDWASLNSIHDANGNIYDTDWIDNAIDDGALTTSHNLSFAGGSKTSTYVISGGYTGQDGVIGGKDVSYYKRYNFRANSEHKMYDGLITVGEHVSFVWKDSRNMGTGNIYNNNLRSAFSASPIMPVYGPDGGYYDTTGSDWNVNDGNPYGTMMVNRYNRSRSGNLDANAYMQVEPIKNLKFKTVFAVGYGASDYRSYTPAYSFSPQSGQTEESVRQSNGHGLSMVWTNTLSYDFTLKGGHDISALVGTEWSKYDGSSTEGYNTGIVPGFDDWDHAWLTNTNGTANKSAKGAPYDPVRSMSYFARLGWSWKDRYMVNATLRADGSSKFAPGNRWGYFPSVSAGWTVSEEDFMKSARSWMDFLKLRVSWGQVGNANINCWQYLAPVTTTNVNYNFGTNGGQEGWSTGSYPSRLANEDVKWETSEQINIGIDARFLSSRLALTADWYVKSTKDWLVQAPVLATAGTAGPIINGGDVKNTGVELGLTWNDNIGRDFTYSVGANFAYNHNEVGSIPTEDGIIHGNTNQIYQNAEEFYRAENGHAIGYFWGYRTAGIFQSKQDIDSWIAAGNGVMQANVQPGDVKYVDINRDGMIDAKDKTDLGNGLPKYTFGFNIMLGWKGFDLGLNATGAAGFKIAQSYRNPNAAQANYSRSILDRWTGEGTSNKMPRVTYNDVGNWLFSDLYLQDGDYIRLQNLTLGYDFKRLIAWKGISRLRLYLQAQNLLTLTKYDGMDPEVGSYNGTDANHVNSDGSTTQTWVSGVDMGYYPHPRTFIVGVNIAF